MRRFIRAIFLPLVVLFAAPAVQAEGQTDFGDYTVHYHAFTTDTLAPQVATTYGLTRSKTRALLNVTVLQRVMGTAGTPVMAKLKGQAVNLAGQLRTLEFREVREGNAIYYLSEFPVGDQDTLDFKVEVAVEGRAEPYQIAFRQQFFGR